MFITSKVLAVLAQPLAWIFVLLGASLFMRNKPALGRRMIWTAWTLLLVLGWLPLSDMLVRRLERQYAEFPTDADLKKYVGMVVLGGSTEPGYVAVSHPQPLLNEAAERLTIPVTMLRHNPHLRLIYTGGGVTILTSPTSEAQLARKFFDSMGVPDKDAVYEAASRTTHENAVLSARLPGVDIKQRWLLVTSAWHMPRSMAAFAAEGWNVTAYPVDFRTGLTTPWMEYSLTRGIRNWNLVLHELLGALAYDARRRIDHL